MKKYNWKPVKVLVDGHIWREVCHQTFKNVNDTISQLILVKIESTLLAQTTFVVLAPIASSFKDNHLD